MNITTIIFDLDGVLIETKGLHAKAFCEAAGEFGIAISPDEHQRDFCGLSTAQKVEKLIATHGFPREAEGRLQERKQELTRDFLATEIAEDPELGETLRALAADHNLEVATNSIRHTTETILEALKIRELFKIVLTNQDVSEPKPDPEIYLKTMSQLGTTPSRTLILEDSPIGIAAARASGAHVLEVARPTQLSSLPFVMNPINQINGTV